MVEAGRISAYLKGDDALLLKAIKEEINHQRRIECDNHFSRTGFVKKYTPIGNSELIVQLLKRFKDSSKKVYIDKLEFHNRQAEYYEERISKMNAIRRDEILKNEN
jgi:hypothetical protein